MTLALRASNFNDATSAPPPMESLRVEIISPENIALEQRQRDAIRLSPLEQAQLFMQVWLLSRWWRKVRRSPQMQMFARLRSELRALQSKGKALNDLLETGCETVESRQEAQEQKEKALARFKELKTQYDGAKSRLGSILQRRLRGFELWQQLRDHKLAVQRDKLEAQLLKGLKKEAKAYERFITHTLNRMGICFKFERDGKVRTKSVKFWPVILTVNTIHYRVRTTEKGYWGWKADGGLPEGVILARHILTDELSIELSNTLGRKVDIVSKVGSGVYLAMRRLQSANDIPELVHWRDVMSRYPKQHNDRLPVCVGAAANNTLQWMNAIDFPHWLIVGETGTGKSNQVNNFICSLISMHSPKEVQFIMIDLKNGTELAYYENIPHLALPMIDEPGNVAAALGYAIKIIKERAKRIKGVAKTVYAYKQLKNVDMPHIIVIFDEFAQYTDKDGHKLIEHISRLGRAFGVSLLLAAQRPDKSVMEGQIKTNLTVRIAGRMDMASSILTLGNGSASTLPKIPGRMAVKYSVEPVEVQTPLISDNIVKDCVAFAKSTYQPFELDVPADEAPPPSFEWTPESVAKLMLEHHDGNVTGVMIKRAIEELSQSQAYAIAEQIWKQKTFGINGKQYQVATGRGGSKRLKEVEAA